MLENFNKRLWVGVIAAGIALIAPAQAHIDIDKHNGARLYGKWESICNAHLVGYLTRWQTSNVMEAGMKASSVSVKAVAMRYLYQFRPKCWRLMTSFDWWVDPVE